MIYPSLAQLSFRPLRADEVEVRPAEAKSGSKATLLLYQDARCAMNILDSTLGRAAWQREYYEAAGLLFCKIGIFDTESNQWLWKSDTGSKSNIEGDKGLASDAFKRAAVAWGIGRELYTAPRISIDLTDKDMYNGTLCQSFKVENMTVTDGNITSLVIVDKWGKKRYEFNSQATAQPERLVKPVTVEQPFKLVQDEDAKLDAVLDEIYKDLPQKQSANEMIKEFCISKKSEPGVEMRQLNNFYRFYTSPSKDSPDKSIAESFKNLDPERLWERWMEKAK